ncbi:replication protein P [Endozoicomonas ascidiicola]|uniref:replication protein P n=1 Tax=Endozoicomonas ascidiicola TaxID=1698521 RepID=UPI000830C824|nr:replication protein P [Endozoicomonas ascidiicola]
MTSPGSTTEGTAAGNVADMDKARESRQVSVFSELSKEDQARIINGVFSELKNSFPGQFLKYVREIPGWEDHERKRLFNDDDFRRLTARQIKSGLTTACKGEFLPSVGRLIQCCQPDLSELGLPDTEQAWQEACNHSHEVIQHRWSHEAVYLAGRRVGWHAIRSAGGDIQVQRLRKLFAAAYQHLVDDTVRGADLRGEAIAALQDMRRQSEEEKAIRYGQFLVQQEMDKQGIPQRMSGAEALKRMKAGL